MDTRILFSSLACSSPLCCLAGCCRLSWETHSPQQLIFDATAVVSMPIHWDVIYTVTSTLVCCYQQYGSAQQPALWAAPLQFFCTGLCDTKDEKQQLVTSATSYQSDRQQSCDYAHLSLESALMRSSAPGTCLRSWHLDSDSRMGPW